MRAGTGRHARGRSSATKWDILLIDDTARYGRKGRWNVTECQGTTIIIVQDVTTAMAVLDTVAVDVIYNLANNVSPDQAGRFRARVVARHPPIRLVDHWTFPLGLAEESKDKDLSPTERPIGRVPRADDCLSETA